MHSQQDISPKLKQDKSAERIINRQEHTDTPKYTNSHSLALPIRGENTHTHTNIFPLEHRNKSPLTRSKQTIEPTFPIEEKNQKEEWIWP